MACENWGVEEGAQLVSWTAEQVSLMGRRGVGGGYGVTHCNATHELITHTQIPCCPPFTHPAPLYLPSPLPPSCTLVLPPSALVLPPYRP